MNYVKLLKKDTGLDNVSEISTDMDDHDDWRERRLVELVLRQGKARCSFTIPTFCSNFQFSEMRTILSILLLGTIYTVYGIN